MTAGLIVVLCVTDLDTTGQVSGIVATVLSGLGLVASVRALTGGGGGSGLRVRAGRRGVAAGGSITGSALGNDANVSGTATTSGTPTGGAAAVGGSPTAVTGEVRAGRDGVAAGGNIEGSALGEGSEVQ
ncbi:hypothetical protein ACIPRL_34700 [Streptomyces sp. NPDC090085]|uniref:hypothetical protein n=1 Tax=Streptomyces sp. NPDC090085 TaxID=3365943 RepID=UPI003817EA6E